MICKPFEVVVVPFPFMERPVSKRRPALVLSRETFNREGRAILAMITSQSHSPWPGDCPVENVKEAGLASPSMVRLKLFTLDNKLMLRKIGRLAPADAHRVSGALKDHLTG